MIRENWTHPVSEGIVVKAMSAAEEMEVAEIIESQEDEMESWSFGDEAQWAIDDNFVQERERISFRPSRSILIEAAMEKC